MHAIPGQRDSRDGAPREPDGADRSEPPEPHLRGRNRERRRFRDCGERRRGSRCEPCENPTVDGLFPGDEERFGRPRVHPCREESGAPGVPALFDESVVHELRHVVPERGERLQKEPRRGPQVQARIRGGGEEDLEAAGMQKPAAAPASGGRGHRDVLYVEDRPDLAGDAGRDGHGTRMQQTPQEVSPLDEGPKSTRSRVPSRRPERPRGQREPGRTPRAHEAG